jgi:hypothetical protein
MAKAKTTPPKPAGRTTRRSKKPARQQSVLRGVAQGLAWLGGKVRDVVGRKKKAKRAARPATKPGSKAKATTTAKPKPARSATKPSAPGKPRATRRPKKTAP